MNLLQEAHNLYEDLDIAFDIQSETNRHIALQLHLLCEETRRAIYIIETSPESEQMAEVIKSLRKQFEELNKNKDD